MANFLENLWNSVFTAGPTPTLLLATNVTFAALQLILTVLLVATYSIHFLILSCLSGGLWASINWFAKEVRIAQSEVEEKERREKDKERQRAEASGSAMDTGDDTETETEIELDNSAGRSLTASGVEVTTGASLRASAVTDTGSSRQWNTSAAQRLAPPEKDENDTSKRRSLGESTSELSTDSEWEKVSEGER